MLPRYVGTVFWSQDMQEVTKYNTTVYFLQLDDFILSSNNSYSYILLMTKGKSGDRPF